MSRLAALTNQSLKAQGKKPKREQKPTVGRDGRNEQIEKYGHDAIASFRDIMSHPLEYLEAAPGLLRDTSANYPGMAGAMDHAMDAGKRRVRLARTYYDLRMGAEITPLASVDFGNVGGGGFGPRNPSDHAIDCIKRLNQIHRDMPEGVRSDMDQVFWHGQFLFNVPSKVARETVLTNLKIGLDIMALETSEMPIQEFRFRWPDVPLIRRRLTRN